MSEHGQQKRNSLPASCFSNANQVPSIHNRWDGLGLNGSGLFIAVSWREEKKGYFKDRRGFDRCKSQSHAEINLYIHIYIYLSGPFKIHSIKMSSKTRMQMAGGISLFHYGVVNADDSACNSYKHGHVAVCNEEKGSSHKGTTEDSKQNQEWQSSWSASLLFEGSENLHGNTTLYPGFYWLGAAFSLDCNSLQLQPVHVHLWNRVCINRKSHFIFLHYLDQNIVALSLKYSFYHQQKNSFWLVTHQYRRKEGRTRVQFLIKASHITKWSYW